MSLVKKIAAVSAFTIFSVPILSASAANNKYDKIIAVMSEQQTNDEFILSNKSEQKDNTEHSSKGFFEYMCCLSGFIIGVIAATNIALKKQGTKL